VKGEDVRQRLAAILVADVAGYSRLMQVDEHATVAAEGGRVVDMAGDSVLAIFETAVGAVRAALAVQETLAAAEIAQRVPEARAMRFRIGVHLGDVIEKADGTVYGDGVNVAARLESLGEPGTVTVSDTARGAVRGRIDAGFAFLGDQRMKNIANPVPAYRVTPDGSDQAAHSRRPRRTMAAAAIAVALVALAGGTALWWTGRATPTRTMVTATGSPTDDPVLAMPTGPSIAVLPFANLSSDPEQDYFADGITEDILTRLSTFSDLRVIARNSTFRYKGQAVDVRQVGRELRAQYALEGSVRRAGNRLRVSVQLLETADGTHVWANDYDRSMTTADIFDIQSEVANSVAANIAGAYGAIAKAGRKASGQKPTASLEAYECVLKAQHYDLVLGPGEHAEARDCLERAVKTDPGYVDAWAWLARLYNHEYAFDFNLRPDPLERSLATAEHAVKLDPNNQAANWELAVSRYFRHELDQFFTQAERAIALNANNVLVIGEAGQYIAWAGRWERGIALSDKAIALSPFFPDWFYFTYYWNQYRKRDFKGALAIAQKINMPDFFWTHAALAAAYGELGRTVEARAAAKSLNELNPIFAGSVHEELRKFNFAEPIIDLFADGLEKAGLFGMAAGPALVRPRAVIATSPARATVRCPLSSDKSFARNGRKWPNPVISR
jgi:adenylate cyclase